tara:strand:- start:96 stop:1061 length:966 start_codon:yes stop_codon:yes gene_type:complete
MNIVNNDDVFEKHTYPIGVVSKRTEIHQETLRVWERRYSVIVPIRTKTGRRLYSESDITKLLILKKLVDLGHPISTLAELNTETLKDRLIKDTSNKIVINEGEKFKCKVVLVGDTFLKKVNHDLAEFNEIEILHYSQNFLVDSEQINGSISDILIIECLTVNIDSLVLVKEQLKFSKSKKVLVLFNFATKANIDLLENSGIVCMKSSVSTSDIVRTCLNLYLKDDNLTLAKEITRQVSRSFSIEELTKLAAISSTVACECPNHLAELIINLNAFEKYSLDCENKNEKDANLHSFLALSVRKARSILEQSLLKLIEAEGIKV